MPKLRADQLSKQLQQGLSSIYLISGDEPLLVQEACDNIRIHASKQGFTERERLYADRQFEWSSLFNLTSSLSLFSEKKLIELKLETGKPGDKGSKAIVEYLENPNPDNSLVITSPKLDGNTQRSKWVKHIEKHGVWVPIWPISIKQMPRWVEQRLQAAGLKASSQSIDLLAARTEGNLLAAHQEIEKLKLLSTDQYLTPEIVAGAVANSARYDVFTLVDRSLEGDSRGATRCLHGLKTEGTEPTVILWALAREIRQLIKVKTALDQGQGFAWAAKQAGIWEKRQGLIQQALRRLTPLELQRLLRQANMIDRSIKGLQKNNPWDELLELTLNLTGFNSLSYNNQQLAIKANSY